MRTYEKRDSGNPPLIYILYLLFSFKRRGALMFQLRCLFKGDFHSRAASLFKKYFISINKSMEKYANFQPKNRNPEEKMSNEKNVNVFNNCESLFLTIVNPIYYY